MSGARTALSASQVFGIDHFSDGNNGDQWSECLCAEIDPSDVPCIVCEAREIRGLPPCAALAFEYRGEWFEFAGYVEDNGDGWDERRYGICVYGFPLDGPRPRADMPGFIFNAREVRALTPTMHVALRKHLSAITEPVEEPKR